MSVQPEQYNRLEHRLARHKGGQRSYIARMVNLHGRLDTQVDMEELVCVLKAIRSGAPHANTHTFNWRRKLSELEELNRKGLCRDARSVNGRLQLYKP